MIGQISGVLTVPNGVTLLRGLASVVAGCLFLGGAEAAAIWIWTLAVALDWLDGWVARRWRQVSALGSFLDPAVDKVAMAGVYGVIGLRAESGVVWLLIGSVVLRDVAVTAERMKDYIVLGYSRPADPVAKLKTCVQSVGGVGALIYSRLLGDGGLGDRRYIIALVAVVAALSYWSWIRYSLAAVGGVRQPGKRAVDGGG